MAKRRANHEGTIHKRSSGTWRAQVYLDGKRLSFTGKTKKECLDWISETKTQIDHGLTFRGSQTTLTEFLDEWLISIRSSRSERTVELYQWIIENRIIPFIGNIKLKDLKPDRLQNLYNHLHSKQGLSAHAVHCTHSVLRTALKHAVKLGLLIRNPCKSTFAPRPKQNEMNFFDEHQVQILLNTARKLDDRFYPLYFIAIHTGMRMAELFGLKWQDLDWDRRTLLVQRQALFNKGGGYTFANPKSNSGHRTIALGNQAMKALSQQMKYLSRIREEAGEKWQSLDLVFPSIVGTPVTHSNLRKQFYKTLEASGLPRIRFHDLRHTAASLMLNNGIPVLIVSKRLGHAKPSTTLNVYGHLIPSKQEEAAALMDELMSPIDVTNCTIFAPDSKKSS